LAGALQAADALRWSERAIRIDPDTSWPRQTVCRAYLDLADPMAARDAIGASQQDTAGPCLADLALYEGDWRRAAQFAFNTPGVALVGPGILGALSRYASETGDTERVLELLRGPDGEQVETSKALAEGLFEQAFLLVQLYQMRGDRAGRERVLEALWRWLPKAERGEFMHRESYPTRAMLMAWSGRDSEALDELLHWTRRRHSMYWWYVFEHDPTWQHLRSDPRFVEARRLEREYVAGQRTTLETLRRHGAVPVRASKAARSLPGPEGEIVARR